MSLQQPRIQKRCNRVQSFLLLLLIFLCSKPASGAGKSGDSQGLRSKSKSKLGSNSESTSFRLEPKASKTTGDEADADDKDEPGGLTLTSSMRKPLPHQRLKLAACNGFKVFIHDLKVPVVPWDRIRKDGTMAGNILNHGLGHEFKLKGDQRFKKVKVFATYQYVMGYMLHNRLLSTCAVTDPKEANLFFIPQPIAPLFMGSRYGSMTDHQVSRFHIRAMKTLKKSKIFARCGGCDHFMVLGRDATDFEPESWANAGQRATVKEFSLDDPFFRNVTKLTPAGWLKNPRANGHNVVAVPFPSMLHPAGNNDMKRWQELVGSQVRDKVVSLAAGWRRIRSGLISRCKDHLDCHYVDCGEKEACSMANVFDLYMKSDFCVMPKGDNPSRRGLFDAWLCGCIPLVFTEEHLFIDLTYPWHVPAKLLPKVTLVASNLTMAMAAVEAMTPQKIQAMRDAIHEMMPRLVYATHTKGGDALDYIFKGIASTRPETIFNPPKSMQRPGL